MKLAIIEQCINTTLEKYKEDKLVYTTEALNDVINNNKFNYFTSDNGARDRIALIGKEALIVELIYGALLSRQIEILRGFTNIDSSTDTRIPINIHQAQDQIYMKMNQENIPAPIYAYVKCSSILRSLLIADYAKLITETTLEERKRAEVELKKQFGNKLDSLEQYQDYLINENQKLIIEMQARQQTQNIEQTGHKTF